MDRRVNIDAAPPPVPRRDWALFLDIDGTLLDIAPTPASVEVPACLVPLLNAACVWLGGALAVVSGRTLTSIDQLLSPLAFPCAAEHGAVVRRADGSLLRSGPAFPAGWLARLHSATAGWEGVLVEPKAFAVALHYRLAPERQSDVRALAQSIAAEDPGFEVMPARMAYEIRHKRLHKGTAVASLMEEPPFAGRVPVFVGDDVTDEDGFRAARALGGLGLHVDRTFSGQPANVRSWLKDFAG